MRHQIQRTQTRMRQNESEEWVAVISTLYYICLLKSFFWVLFRMVNWFNCKNEQERKYTQIIFFVEQKIESNKNERKRTNDVRIKVVCRLVDISF